MHVRLYTRTDGGQIACHGVTAGWDSLREAGEHYGPGHPCTPEIEQVMGWPDDEIHWYGNAGVAPIAPKTPQPAPKD